MKVVYIAYSNFPDDPTTIYGVFSSEAIAAQAMQDLQQSGTIVPVVIDSVIIDGMCLN